MNKKKLLWRLLSGARQNVNFRDFVGLVEAFGFSLDRIQGSHQVFRHGKCKELLNLQEFKGQAKPYQIAQFLTLVEEYNLEMEKDDDD